MKVFIAAVFALTFSLTTKAQSTATSVAFDKAYQTGFKLPLPYDLKVAEGTIIQKLKETGYDPETKGKLFWKQNKMNDFYVFKGVHLDGMGDQIMDLYFKVTPDNSVKDGCIMYLLASKGNENFITETDKTSFSSVQSFFNKFTSETAKYNHNLNVLAQEDAVKKAEKKLTSLQDDEKDLHKKFEKLQDDLAKNKADQESQQKSLESERRKLDEVRAKD
jgi:hypothetical protein